MIDKSSFEKALGVANIFAAKGLAIVPEEGTPLAQLVGTTNLVGQLPTYSSETEFVAEDSTILSMVSENETHDALYDDYVNALSTGLSFQINNARNIINPIINEAVEAIKKYVAENNTSAYSFELIQKDIPTPLQNDSFVQEVTKNDGGSFVQPRGRITIRDVSDIAGITEKLVTGSEIFDSSVKEWIDNKGEAFIVDLWKKTFASVHEGPYQTLPELMDVFKGPDALDNALFVYLVSRKLMDDAPEYANMSLANWRETVRDYINNSAKTITREISMGQTMTSNKTLVTRVDFNNKVVIVNGPVYRDYIATGGKNEIIFGAIVSDEVPYSLGVILANPEKYQKAWDSYASINKASLRAKAFASFKEACEFVLVGQLNSLAEFEQEKFNENSAFRDTIVASYKNLIKHLYIEDMNNIYHTVMKLVCNGRFPYTDAYRFLDAMNDIAKDNPELDPREAATVATIEYISDHMADQMKLV